MDEAKVETVAGSIVEDPSPTVVEPITIKDPRKVEQGKKLAAISKAAKEKKMREKIEAEMSEKRMSIPIPLLVGIPLVGGYILYRLYNAAGKSTPSPSVVVPVPLPSVKTEESPSPPKKKQKKFESFD